MILYTKKEMMPTELTVWGGFGSFALQASSPIGIISLSVQKSQEKLLKKIENNKKIALAKAAALLGKNKTKIASMTGIYIP